MNNPFRSIQDYELFLYTLTKYFSPVKSSTVVLIRRGTNIARVTGEIGFDQSFRLVVKERIVSREKSISLNWYGYEVWKGDQKQYWYDPQPHPNDKALPVHIHTTNIFLLI